MAVRLQRASTRTALPSGVTRDVSDKECIDRAPVLGVAPASEQFLAEHYEEMYRLTLARADAAEQERDNWVGWSAENVRIIKNVRALHGADPLGQFCEHDGFAWPCRTSRVLDGDS